MFGKKTTKRVLLAKKATSSLKVYHISRHFENSRWPPTQANPSLETYLAIYLRDPKNNIYQSPAPNKNVYRVSDILRFDLLANIQNNPRSSGTWIKKHTTPSLPFNIPRSCVFGKYTTESEQNFSFQWYEWLEHFWHKDDLRVLRGSYVATSL